MPQLMDRFECFKAIFGAHYARQFGNAGYRELLAACADATNPLGVDMAPAQRDRLYAVLRLSELWYPEQDASPTSITCLGDVVRLIRPRVLALTDRVVWLLALDASGSLTDEVLVQMGGGATEPPALRMLLRHALFKGAVSAWVVDFRPIERCEVPPETVAAFAALRDVGATIGIHFDDWVLFCAGSVCSVREVTSACDHDRTALFIAA